MSKRFRSNVLLLLTAFIWGSAFVAQKVGGDLGTFTFNGVRTFIGGLSLIPVILILDALKKKKSGGVTVSGEDRASEKKILLTGGILCGVVLFIASTLQQYGINFTTAGKSGFITALYTVIVPFLAIATGKKVKKIIWLCVVLGVAGLYFLTMKPGESFYIQKGDFFVLLCAFAFAVHIMVIDYFSPKTDGVKMSCIQFLIAGGLGMICMFIFETPTIAAIMHSIVPILYAGVLSCGVAYTLQIVAQANAEPSEASLILCLESVFAVITGAMFLGESMSFRGYMGCALIFAAVVLSQLPSKEERLRAKSEK